MSLWYLNILGTLIEGVNHLEKLLFFFKKKWILRFCGMTLIRYYWEGTCKDQNIGKHGYIGNWILRKYRKYRKYR